MYAENNTANKWQGKNLASKAKLFLLHCRALWVVSLLQDPGQQHHIPSQLLYSDFATVPVYFSPIQMFTEITFNNCSIVFIEYFFNW